MTKIVCIGAGSYSFGLSTLITLLQSEKLNGAEIALVDTNAESLDLISELANWLNISWSCHKQITSHATHKTALSGANFVISALEAQPREQLWKQDFEISLRHGLRQPYAENGGPGGFAHAARNVNSILEIVQDMEHFCPEAWFINFTNPMQRVCYLINEYSKIKVVGLCHQLGAGYAMAAKALAGDFGIDRGEDFISTHADPKNHEPMERMSRLGQKHLKITAAGLNHFTWMVALQNRQTGEDLYPLFRQRWQALDPAFEPLTREIFEIYKMFPIPGDEHMSEYLPWLSNPYTQPWVKYDLSLYDWDLYDSFRSKQWTEIARLLQERGDSFPLRNPTSEGAVEVIEGISQNTPLFWEALNIPNAGYLNNLPKNAIVEVPGTLSGSGIRGEIIGTMPKAITGLLQREVIVSQLCIDAVVSGDRQLALESLLLDPITNDIGLAKELLDDILKSYQPYLPQFWE